MIIVQATAFVACFACLAAMFLPRSDAATVTANAKRSAVLSGVVIQAGGPPSASSQRTYGHVHVLAANGRLITTVRATPQTGFSIRLAPGRYLLTTNRYPPATVECKPTAVVAKAHKATWVRVFTGCGES